ncbi:MAG: DUF1127 domain-containing protein [Hoeflea sp.]|uniref:DUF1127 domain-containing protein n=1 Tax=Hoeflea sp. TaxID=1940281 RepID=UPI003EF179C0
MNVRSLTATRSAVHTLSFGSAVQNFVLTVAGNARPLAKALFHRRLARKIEEMSDYELSDIGLTRDDVRHGFSMPLTTDPTVELARRARLNSYA